MRADIFIFFYKRVDIHLPYSKITKNSKSLTWGGVIHFKLAHINSAHLYFHKIQILNFNQKNEFYKTSILKPILESLKKTCLRIIKN